VTETTPSSASFFQGVAEGKLVALRCGRCGALEIPPREFCPSCHARDWTTTPLAGDGVIASYTVIRVPPAPHAGTAPYGVAVVRLREGVSLIGRVVDLPLDRLEIGLPVRFRPLVAHGTAAIGFAPASPA
jgi:uncharacterized OB-fold protein